MFEEADLPSCNVAAASISTKTEVDSLSLTKLNFFEDHKGEVEFKLDCNGTASISHLAIEHRTSV
jgi:hypothetical protein